MSSPTPPAAVPRWLILVGSAAIVLHLTAVVINVLTAPSGPWPTPWGGDMVMPPQFAYSASEIAVGADPNKVKLVPAYLLALKMTHHYHFATDRPGMPGVYFEVRLRDAEGQEIDTLRFPDARANTWVRHRQQILALGLSDDVPFVPPTTDSAPAPGKDLPKVVVWIGGSAPEQRLEEKYVHLLDKERPTFRPSDWSMLVARAYARHLCRAHGAAKAELIRYSRSPYPPAVLAENGAPPATEFQTIASNFGELSK